MNLRSARSAIAVRTGLVATLCAATAIGTYGYFTGHPVGGDATHGSGVSASADEPASFTTADVGACLTWNVAESGEVTNFEQTPCESEHRFEVSARENLGTYPSSEFGDEAPRPDLTRQAQLREELCQAPTLRFLNGRFDPVGRYSIAPILPPAAAWEAGDRTMLCGLQSTDSSGMPMLTVGSATTQDQARVSKPGECVFVDNSASLRTVNCSEDHNLEVTQVVDLSSQFPEGVPSVEDQDRYLSGVCTQAAMDYLGGEEQLYQSTLQPYWGTLEQASWIGGSRSVNCALTFAREDGAFATVTGSAKDGRDALKVDGQTPAAPPERDPLRESAATP